MVVRRRTGDALLNIRANFCNVFDSHNRIVYTPALPGAPPDAFAEWMTLQVQAGSTHVPFGPFCGGDVYPGIGWSNPNLLADPDALRALVLRVLDTPSADGLGVTPVLFLNGGDVNPLPIITEDYPIIAKALDGLHQYLVVVPAWEPIPGLWTSYELKCANDLIGQWFPAARLANHFQPTRWVGSSNPVEPDDPWQGAEADFYKTHGGQNIAICFYQTPHGEDGLYDPCECPDAAVRFGHLEHCWLNRFEDGVARLGAGYHGWRKIGVCLYETTAMESFRHHATPAQSQAIARLGQEVAAKWSVPLSFGNGLP